MGASLLPQGVGKTLFEPRPVDTLPDVPRLHLSLEFVLLLLIALDLVHDRAVESAGLRTEMVGEQWLEAVNTDVFIVIGDEELHPVAHAVIDKPTDTLEACLLGECHSMFYKVTDRAETLFQFSFDA